MNKCEIGMSEFLCDEIHRDAAMRRVKKMLGFLWLGRKHYSHFALSFSKVDINADSISTKTVRENLEVVFRKPRNRQFEIYVLFS